MATVTKQQLKNYKLPASASAVDMLAALGFDEALYGRPGRALIRPHYKDIIFLGGIGGQAGLTGTAADCIWEPVFEDCEFTVERTADGKGEAKWGAIPYGMVRPTFIRCKFYDINKEHGIYPHGLMGATFIECEFLNIGAQAVQVSERTAHHGGFETWDKQGRSILMPGEILMLRCKVVNCGKPSGAGRASFALTFFGPQTDDPAFPVPFMSAVGVVVQDTIIRHRDSLGGALNFQRRPYARVIGGETDYRSTGGSGAKPIAFFNGSKGMELKDLRIASGKIDLLDCPKGEMQIRNCSGQALVRVGATQPNGSTKYVKIGTLDSLKDATL